MENPIKIDDLGVPLFLETPMYFFKFQGCNISSSFSHSRNAYAAERIFFFALRLLSQSHVRYSSSEESSSSFEHSAEVSNLNWKVWEGFNEWLFEGQHVDITI